VGNPPSKSPSLVNYPACDEQVQELATELWANKQIRTGRASLETVKTQAGQLVTELYPPYDSTVVLLEKLGVHPDFTASGSIRYIHRSLPDRDIYFISNRTSVPVDDVCLFRDGTLNAELWDAVTGEIRYLNDLTQTGKGVSLKVKLDASQSFFVVFYRSGRADEATKPDFPEKRMIATLEGPWTVAFDTLWGGPEEVVFDALTDWTVRPEEGIRFYSGIARYSKQFDMPETTGKPEIFLDLGMVKNMARVRLNGKDLGVVWTSPWQVNITDAVKEKGNTLEIDVANLWANRLIGDESFPDDGVKDGKWPDWVVNGTQRPSRRYTFTTHRFYKKDDPLLESGLRGTVRVMKETYNY